MVGQAVPEEVVVVEDDDRTVDVPDVVVVSAEELVEDEDVLDVPLEEVDEDEEVVVDVVVEEVVVAVVE